MTRYNNTNKQPSIYLVENKSMKKNKNVRLDDLGLTLIKTMDFVYIFILDFDLFILRKTVIR